MSKPADQVPQSLPFTKIPLLLLAILRIRVRSTRNTRRWLVPGTCPSCTQIAYWAPPVPPALPSHLSAQGNESTLAQPSKTGKNKKEPGSETLALDKVEVMEPDKYLRSEYEKHKSALIAKGESGRNATKALPEKDENGRDKGKDIMKINGNNGAKP